MSKKITSIKNQVLNDQILIKLDNVSFSYTDNNNDKIIEDLNFEIKKNSKIAIIGKSGIGKSTFLDILTGLRNPTNGNIILNKNIYMDLRHILKISYVDQSPYLIDDNLKNNITFGEAEFDQKDFTDQQIYL